MKNRDYREYWFDLGNTYYNQGMFDRAIQAYAEVINCCPFTKELEWWPKISDIYISRGNAYKALGNLSATICDYNKAVSIDKAKLELLTKLIGDIFSNIKKHDLDCFASKQDIFFVIKILPIEKQIPLLEKCLNQDNPLGNRLWKQEGVNECSRESGTLKEIREHLGELYVKQGRIKIGNEILRKCPPQGNELEVPESAIGMHNRL